MVTAAEERPIAITKQPTILIGTIEALGRPEGQVGSLWPVELSQAEAACKDNQFSRFRLARFRPTNWALSFRTSLRALRPPREREKGGHHCGRDFIWQRQASEQDSDKKIDVSLALVLAGWLAEIFNREGRIRLCENRFIGGCV